MFRQTPASHDGILVNMSVPMQSALANSPTEKKKKNTGLFYIKVEPSSDFTFRYQVAKQKQKRQSSVQHQYSFISMRAATTLDQCRVLLEKEEGELFMFDIKVEPGPTFSGVVFCSHHVAKLYVR